jgi:hypothetical protein
VEETCGFWTKRISGQCQINFERWSERTNWSPLSCLLGNSGPSGQVSDAEILHLAQLAECFPAVNTEPVFVSRNESD